MKKTITRVMVFLLALSLLTACGGGSKPGNEDNSGNSAPPASTDSGGGGNTDGEDDENTSAKPYEEVINPSELISRDDADRILDISTFSDESEVDIVDSNQPGGLNSIYSLYISEEYLFQIRLYQDALLEGLAAENGGMSAWIQNQKSARDTNVFNQEIIPVEGIGDGGYLVNENSLGVWTIELFKGDYCISITITYNPPTTHTRNDEDEGAWRKEKLTEAGKLAVERLEAIIK